MILAVALTVNPVDGLPVGDAVVVPVTVTLTVVVADSVGVTDVV